MTIPTRFKFTQRSIDQLPPNPEKSRSRFSEYSDAETTGLKALVSKTGRKFFYARLTFQGSKRTIKLGEFPAQTVAEAKQLLLELRAKINRGIDPSMELKSSLSTVTFKQFAEKDYLPYAKAHKRSVASDISKLKTHLLPRFGNRCIYEISLRDIQTYHAEMKISHCAATANRHLSLLSKMFSCAVQWDFLKAHPCRGITKFNENNSDQRFLSGDEIRKLYAAMENVTARSDMTVAALKFLLLTGMRKNEVLHGQWQNVDLERGIWYVPQTKNGKSNHVVLNAEAKTILLNLPRETDSVWVFPGRNPKKPLVEVRRCLNQLAKKAGIPPLKVHSLRHSFASICAQQGVPLLQIKSLLNHASTNTTLRYAHLANADLLSATQSVGDAVTTALKAQ
jgi:integrase